MKYSPSYLTFTPTRTEAVVVIEGENLTGFRLENAKIVAMSSKAEQLNQVVCTVVTPQSFGRIEKTARKVSIRFAVTEQISEKLKNCITDKNQTLALQIDIPSKNLTGKIVTQQQVLIPIFDNSQGNILTKTRTSTVLGELQSQLKINKLECDRVILTTRQEVSCVTEIINTTDIGVFASVTTSIQEGLPPGLTLYESVERTNILLLPGQSYNVNFKVPKDKYNVLSNKISVISNFTSIGAEGTDFTAHTTEAIWYIPAVLLVIIAVTLLTISAILFRKKRLNFISSPHGAQKANS